MKDRLFEFVNSSIGSIVLIFLGILMIIEANFVLPFARVILIVALVVLAIVHLFNLIFDKKKHFRHLMFYIFYILLVYCIYEYPGAYIKFHGYIIGIYALINAMIMVIDYFVARDNHETDLVSRIVKIIIYLVFAIALFIIPYRSTSLVFAISGIYLVIFGGLQLISNIKQLSNKKFNLAISVPVLLSAIIPVSLFFKVRNNHEVYEHLDDNPYDDQIAPLEINIYVQGGGFESFGHLDISIDGTIYSYGCHDPNGRTLFGAVGDGVLIKVKRSDFLENAMKTKKTMIFNFSLNPDAEVMDSIRHRLDSLMQDAVPFDCAARKQELANEPMTAEDYISDVYKDTHCELYKFKDGRFKRYFVFTTNCVLLSDYLIRNNEIDLFNMNGIVTPGAYLNYLFQLYVKKDSIIKSLRIYKKSQKQK